MAASTLTVARKEHRCSLCHKPIPAGNEYIRQDVAPWEQPAGGDGRYFTYRAHLACDQIWTQVSAELDGFLPIDEDAWNEAVETAQWMARQRAAG